MAIDSRIESALRGGTAVDELRSLAIALHQEGRQHATVLEFFDRNRQALREAGRESDEAAVLEVMDFLVGWCSPHVSLAPKQP